MNNKKYALIGFLGTIIALPALLALLLPSNTIKAAVSKYGMPGIYNASPLTLANGDGSALAVDYQGRVILSTTTVVSLSSGGLVMGSSTIGSLSVTNTLSVSGLTPIGAIVYSGSGGALQTSSSLLIATNSFGSSTIATNNKILIADGFTSAFAPSQSFQMGGSQNSGLLNGVLAVDAGNYLNQILVRYSDTFSRGSQIRLLRARGTPIATSSAQAGDIIGNIISSAYDGTDFDGSTSIQFTVDGAVANNAVPGRITLHTTSDGAQAVTERFRINSTGTVMIGTTTPMIGANSIWHGFVIATGTLLQGNLRQDGLAMIERGLIVNASSSIGSYLTVSGNIFVSSSILVGAGGTYPTFVVDSSGNLSASGTSRLFGLSTLSGGFISSASSSIGSDLSVSGKITVSTSLMLADGFVRKSLPVLYSAYIPQVSTTPDNYINMGTVRKKNGFAQTIQECQAVIDCTNGCGTGGPGITLNLVHGTNRSASTTAAGGTALFSADINVNSTTTVQNFCASGCDRTVAFTDNTLAAGEFIWPVVSAASGTTMNLDLTCYGDES